MSESREDSRPDHGRSDARPEAARLRDDAAAERDRVAVERDAAARERDERASALEAELALGGDAVPRLRAFAAEQRTAAARDRRHAADDRARAAHEREAAARELAAEGTDALTGAMRRGVGLAAIRRELDRTLRSGEPHAIAFVDVDGLKALNDGHGHPAGDALLAEVGRAIRAGFRSYDLLVRVGGDEFVCSYAGQDAAAAGARLDRIAAGLAAAAGRPVITAGCAERHEADGLDALIARADAAMIASRVGRREER